MKRFGAFLLSLLVLLSLIPAALAEGSGEELMSETVYHFSEDDSVVPVYDLFLSVYEKDRTDIRLICGETEWFFSCDNVFRNTQKWADFSASVRVIPNPELPEALPESVASREIFLIDFRDGDLFPGPAEISLPAGSSGTEYSLVEVAVSEAGHLVLTPVAEHISPDSDGILTLTLTEAHDFLLIPGDPGPLSSYAPQVTIPAAGNSFLTVLISVLIVLAAALLAYFVIRLILKKTGRRAKS
ncbi:MAG: hypothetical protein J5938_06000 [Clostridia bacterium]|nr:hypothetical protein [Clostridia bacterium]MBO4798040.1 hypothetical protein [Candidatus Methanomethylophilaceae archaeon]